MEAIDNPTQSQKLLPGEGLIGLIKWICLPITLTILVIIFMFSEFHGNDLSHIFDDKG